MSVNYVRFFRGSSLAFQNAVKDKDTLYFITDANSNRSSLYLGEKLISGGISSVSELNDILFSELKGNQLLIYDENQSKWINKDILDIVPIMTGAANGEQGGAGLVPAPGIGAENFFLRGDGTWAPIVGAGEGDVSVNLFADNKTLEILGDGVTVALKDFGQKYYKFIPATGSIENGDYVAAHYVLQIVDATNPWIEGLEPRVVKEGEELILGWFEPKPGVADGIGDEVAELKQKVTDLNTLVETQGNTLNTLGQSVTNNTNDISELKTKVTNLETDILSKANADDVYTKQETDEKINQAVASLDHLRRKIFNSLEEAEQFAAEQSNPDSYIYMVLNTDDALNEKYDEYLWADGALNKVGSWDVDLEGYVTDTELATSLMTKVDKKDGYSLIADTDIAKLAGIEEGAQKNLFDNINTDDFFIDENSILKLQPIPMSKVEGLNDALTNINTKVTQVETNLSSLNSTVTNLSTLINNDFVKKVDYDAAMAKIEQSIMWQDLPES